MNKRRYLLISVMTLSTLCYTLPYLSSTFYTQFMEAFGLSNEQVGSLISMFGLTAVPGYLFGVLLATAGGLLLDKLKTPKTMSLFSAGMILMLVVIVFMPQNAIFAIGAFIICVLFSSIMGASRSGLYTPIPEAKMPMSITGTAIGICSAIGYSSDLWLYTLCGKWLDSFGNAGYRYIWILTMGSVAMVIVCCILLHIYEKKHRVFG